MNNELETAYIGIDCTKPGAVATYLQDVVGLMPGEPRQGAASTWRVDGKGMRLWLQQAERDDAACIGFTAGSVDAYQRGLARLKQIGVECASLTAEQKALRGVQEGVSMRTPWGVPLELVHGLADATTPFESASYPDGLVTQGQGFGHFVFVVGSAEDYEASRRFAIEGLGLKLTDWLRMPIGGEMEMNVSFFHCNARHHSLAVGFVPMPSVPQSLHHINFEVAQVATVGSAYERALNAGTPLANTLGQHANDGMVSFYSLSPAGWAVEVGATGRTVTEDWADSREYDRISDWGHQPPDVLKQMLFSNNAAQQGNP
ncbi:MAG: VOC family protein [Rubrivivax sp.]